MTAVLKIIHSEKEEMCIQTQYGKDVNIWAS